MYFKENKVSKNELNRIINKINGGNPKRVPTNFSLFEFENGDIYFLNPKTHQDCSDIANDIDLNKLGSLKSIFSMIGFNRIALKKTNDNLKNYLKENIEKNNINDLNNFIDDFDSIKKQDESIDGESSKHNIFLIYINVKDEVFTSSVFNPGGNSQSFDDSGYAKKMYFNSSGKAIKEILQKLQEKNGEHNTELRRICRLL